MHASAAPDAKPTPVVTIDNLSDPLATIVEISFGDLLGELLDTVRGRARLSYAVAPGGVPHYVPCTAHAQRPPSARLKA